MTVRDVNTSQNQVNENYNKSYINSDCKLRRK